MEMKKSFIVVDDAVFMRTILKNMIEDVDEYVVIAEASNGIEAVEKAAMHQPDVMTLDITMPDMDGIAAVKEILRVSPNTKIIMCSAMGQQSMVMEALKMGAKDFIVKPFVKNRVMQAIKSALYSS